jgi:hypothetical protein
MKSFMLITGLLFSAVVNSAFGAELADADSQSDLAEMLKPNSGTCFKHCYPYGNVGRNSGRQQSGCGLRRNICSSNHRSS